MPKWQIERAIMTSQEMMKATAGPGYWFVNVAKLGDTPDWQRQVMPQQPNNLLFGYEPKAFLQKQYR